MVINYSFIIPHHNSPELLQRCIDSIPQRNDVEVIVVDDNSDVDKRPVGLRGDVKLLSISKQETKGAGKARNEGMKMAVGKWLLFADCDDFYKEGFLDVLDKYEFEDLDMVCFDVFFAYDSLEKKEKWPNYYSKAICRFLETPNDKNLKIVKHISQVPWNFMVKRQIPLMNGIYYEEIPKGNDAYFHHMVSMASNKVEVISEKLYYWTWNTGSISHKKRTKKEFFDGIARIKKITLLRIRAEAWETVPPLLRGFYSTMYSYGLYTCVRYYISLLFCGIPWYRIWIQKMMYQIKYRTLL